VGGPKRRVSGVVKRKDMQVTLMGAVWRVILKRSISGVRERKYLSCSHRSSVECGPKKSCFWDGQIDRE
jgi:hypothetical protein